MRWLRHLLERITQGRSAETPPTRLDLPSRQRQTAPTPQEPTRPIEPQAVEAAFAVLRTAAPQDLASIGPRQSWMVLDVLGNRRVRGLALLHRDPEIAWLLILDRDGHLRQGALERLDRPPQHPFEVLAIALRLNDWAPQVRQAATAAARRLFPDTPAEVVAPVAGFLVQRRFSWARWTGEADVLDTLLGRADVVEHLAREILTMPTGPGRLILQDLLRFPVTDAWLPILAAEARLPAVRAAALETLVLGRAKWPVGSGWRWIDKTYGLRQRIVLTDERPLSAPVDAAPLVRRAVRDRSAQVRKIAADGLYTLREAMPDAGDIARDLLDDRSSGVRDRAEFLLRKL